MSRPLKRREIKPGLRINHLGTVYTITGVQDGMVEVVNPETGFTGTYRKKLIVLNSRKVED